MLKQEMVALVQLVSAEKNLLNLEDLMAVMVVTEGQLFLSQKEI